MSDNSSGHDNIWEKKGKNGPEMSELDEAWERALAEAERRAIAHGRGDVVEYLALRATNDLARKAGLDWLFETFTALAGEANRGGASVQTSRREGHRFGVGSATMVGALLTFETGVRRLLVEAGWPRAPQDGFVRGGGLALARIRHFGNRAADEELVLVRSENGCPQWLVQEKAGARTQLLEERVRHHIRRFLGTT